MRSPSARAPIHTVELGQGPRVVLVHGAMTSGRQAWAEQLPLAERWRLVIPDRRGYAPYPPAECSDFTVDVKDIEPLLGEGAHVVGHSYGGLVAMLMAAQQPDLVLSLTLIEPAAHALAARDVQVQDAISRYQEVRAQHDPEEFLDGFVSFLGLSPTGRPRPMGSRTAQHVGMAMRERQPWTADLQEGDLSNHPYPVLILSGGRGDVFEVLARATAGAYGSRAASLEEQVFPGATHRVQSIGGPVNDLLERFWSDTVATERLG